MINEYIKKIVFVLLLALLSYIIILVFPTLYLIFTKVLGIALPFIIAFILAFILNPLVSKIQTKVKSRKLSILIVISLIVIILGSFLLYTIPKVKYQLDEFKQMLPEIIEYIKRIISDFSAYFQNIFGSTKVIDEISLEEKLYSFFESILNFGSNLAKNIIYIISMVLIIPVLTIYFLNYYGIITSKIKSFLIEKKKNKFLNYLLDLSNSMRIYVKGVVIVMFILFVIFSIIFTFLKIPYALIFALFIGITNIIPYFGAYIGSAFPVLFALSDSYIKALVTIGICILVQTVESDFITPMINKKYNKLNPVFSILAVLVFGRLFGFFGMILAIPLANVIKITLRHYPIKYFSLDK